MKHVLEKISGGNYKEKVSDVKRQEESMRKGEQEGLDSMSPNGTASSAMDSLTCFEFCP